MLSAFLDQPAAGPSLLRLDARRHNQMAASIFGRTPRLPFTIVLTEACGVQSDAALRELLATVSQSSDADEIKQLLDGKLTEDQVPTLQVFLTGKHRVETGFVVVGGDAHVELVGHGIALVFGKATVTARGEYEVYADGTANVTAYDKSRVDAGGNVTVKSFDHVQGVARGNVRGIARGMSQWQAENEANFDAYDRAQVNGKDQVTLHGFGNSRIIGQGNSRAFLHEEAHGWFDEEVVVEVEGRAVSYITESVTVARRKGIARILSWDRA